MGVCLFRKRFSRHIVQLGACRLDFVSIHIVFKNVSMLLRYFRVSVFHHQVSCLASVVLHVEQLFAVSSFVVQYIFVACGAYHPAPCLAAVELCFGNDILLVGSLRIAFFGYLRNDFPSASSGSLAPAQSQTVAKKSTPLLMSCGSFVPACFLPGRGYDERDVYHFLVQGRFLVPVVGAYSVSVVAGEDNDGILPQVILVDGVYNLADFTVYFLYEAVVCVAVHTPVFRGVKVAVG